MTVAAVFSRVTEMLTGAVTRGICRNVDPEMAFTSSTVPVAGRIYWMRLREGGKVSSPKFNVVTASGHICIAYARNEGSGKNAKPGQVIATTGAFECPGSGTTNVTEGAVGDHEQPLNIPASMRPGDWVGVAADNTTVALRCATGAGAVDTILAAGSGYRETIAAGSPAIPTSRAALTPHISKNWLITS